MHRADRRKFGRGVIPLMFVTLVHIVIHSECRGENKIDVNTATCQEIVDGCDLKPDRAKGIVDYRDSHGPFSSLEDLIGIKGIGRKAVEKIKADITVSDNLRCWNCGSIRKGFALHVKRAGLQLPNR